MAKILVKNMVCNRCIMVVQNEIDKLHLPWVNIELGEITLKYEPTKKEIKKIENALNGLGFEIIENKKEEIIQKIKSIIIELIHFQNGELKNNLSNILSSALHQEYSSISNLFSEIEGITIEKYFILQKIEKVKELLLYNELSLGEIADKLNYSSPAYLSNQFKKVTGLTPSSFKQVKGNKRNPLDQLYPPKNNLK